MPSYVAGAVDVAVATAVAEAVHVVSYEVRQTARWNAQEVHHAARMVLQQKGNHSGFFP